MSDQAETQDAGTTDDAGRDDSTTQANDDTGLKSALQKERDARRNAEKTLKTLEAKIADIEGKDKTAVERLTGERDQLRKDLEDRSTKLRLTIAEQAFRDAAESAGARNPRLLFRAYRDDLEVDDEGGVTNVDALLKQAKKDAPELFGTGGGKADGGRGGGSQSGATNMNTLLRQRAGISG